MVDTPPVHQPPQGLTASETPELEAKNKDDQNKNLKEGTFLTKADGEYMIDASGREILVRPNTTHPRFQPNLTGYVCNDPSDKFTNYVRSPKAIKDARARARLSSQPRMRGTKRPLMPRDATMPNRSHAGKPFGYPSVNISDEQILEAMPENASSIFHVVDRRINFDAHAPDASFYSLLRSWVQDDPYQKVPACGTNLLEYADLPLGRRVVTDAVLANAYPVGKDQATKTTQEKQTGGNDSSEGELEKCDTFGNIMKNHGRSVKSNQKSLVDRSKAVKRRKIEERKKRDGASMERLKSLGIILPNRGSE